MRAVFMNLFRRTRGRPEESAGRTTSEDVMARCENCGEALRADGRYCHGCGALAAGGELPPMAVQVGESQRSLAIQFASLARATCGSGISLVEDPEQAKTLGFPDDNLDLYGKFGTVCLARDGRAALFLVSKRHEGMWRDVPFKGGRLEPIEIHVLEASLFSGAMSLAAAFQRQTNFKAEVVKEF
jgi:hypothetical protein